MCRNQDWRTVSFFVLLLLGFQLCVGETYDFFVRPTQSFLINNAENTATAWGKSFHQQFTPSDQKTLFEQERGEIPPHLIGSMRANVPNSGDIFKVSLFSMDGYLLSKRTAGSLRQKRKDEIADLVAKTGKPETTLLSGVAPHYPESYAETYVPIVSAQNKTIGIAKIYIDQTNTLSYFRSALLHTVAGVALIVFVAFSIPAIAFYVRTRQKQKADEKLAFLASFDPMTGLMNRRTFLDTLDEQLELMETNDKSLAVLYIDIDRFKLINDTFGHQAGDSVILEVAQRLQTELKNDGFVGRMGGDEFVITLLNISEQQQVERFAEQLISKMKEPFSNGQNKLFGSVSIGIALAPEDGCEAGELLKRADVALYCAKSEGRNDFRFFEPSMDNEIEVRNSIENLIRTAVEKKGFELHFQPLCCAKDRQINGFEALLRLEDGQGKYVSPDKFVPIAEEIGLIGEIGEWVLNRACRAAVNWPDNVKIAVNLSPLQFRSNNLVKKVKSALEKSGLCPSRLELEITEGLLLTNIDTVMEQLKNLKALGVSIVMDDFGTGYSSLSYLWQFPLDKIKIDRSFMMALERSDDNVENILSTIISLGHSLNMRVTAEGVETKQQADLLSDLSCDQLQGYFLGRPMKEENIAGTILNNFCDRQETHETPQNALAVANI